MFSQRAEARASKPTPLPDGTRLGRAINEFLVGRMCRVVGTKIAASLRELTLMLWRCGVVAVCGRSSRLGFVWLVIRHTQMERAKYWERNCMYNVSKHVLGLT